MKLVKVVILIIFLISYNYVSAEELSYNQALAKARQNELKIKHTPYADKLSRFYEKFVREKLPICRVMNDPIKTRDFVVVMQLDKNGDVLKIWKSSSEPLVNCYANKLSARQFPKPPFNFQYTSVIQKLY